jgi:hypothetical protein
MFKSFLIMFSFCNNDPTVQIWSKSVQRFQTMDDGRRSISFDTYSSTWTFGSDELKYSKPFDDKRAVHEIIL